MIICVKLNNSLHLVSGMLYYKLCRAENLIVWVQDEVYHAKLTGGGSKSLQGPE